MRRIAGPFAALLAVVLSATTWAIDPVELPDPQLQARYVRLTHELRCVKCQNQSIADSPIDAAADIRREVREMLVEGKSDEEIREFFVARYGDFIVFRPRMIARNAWLWIAPGALLLLGAFVAIRIIRQRSAMVVGDDEPLEEDTRG